MQLALQRQLGEVIEVTALQIRTLKEERLELLETLKAEKDTLNDGRGYLHGFPFLIMVKEGRLPC